MSFILTALLVRSRRYHRALIKDTEDTFLKANLSIYDNNTLIVTGTSYYLWTMDNFKVHKEFSFAQQYPFYMIIGSLC